MSPRDWILGDWQPLVVVVQSYGFERTVTTARDVLSAKRSEEYMHKILKADEKNREDFMLRRAGIRL